MKLVRVLGGESFESPPFWLMRQAGRYLPEYRALREKAHSFLDFCMTPELAVEVTLQPLRRFPFDAAIIFSDILVVPHAMGQQVSFVANEGPVLGDIPNIREIDWGKFSATLQPLFDAISIVRRELSPDKALIGFAGAPWTLMTYMIEGRSSRGYERTRQFLVEKPEESRQLLSALETGIVLALEGQIKAGANVVQLFDSWAGSVPAFLRHQLVFEPTRRIIRQLRQNHPDIPLVGFPRGLSFILDTYVRETGVSAAGLDFFVDPASVMCDCPVQGGIDPVLLVSGGDPMRREILRYLDVFRGRPYIFNLGHGVLPQTPLDHVYELSELVGNYGKN